MADSWSYLILLFGLAGSLASAMRFPNSTAVVLISESPAATPPFVGGIHPQTAAMRFPNSTTLTMTPLDPTVTQSLSVDALLQTVAIDTPIPAILDPMIPSDPAATLSLNDGNLMQTVATDRQIPTTLVTLLSADPPTTQSPSDVDSDFNPIPTTSSALSVVSSYTVPTPTPGSIAILNGIPIRLLSNIVQQDSPVLADTIEGSEGGQGSDDIYEPWDTNYPGPIHEDDWDKYINNWDVVWWSLHLDSLRQTSCICSAADYLTNPQAQVAAYMNLEYYSHQSGTLSTITWACGPAPSSMSLSERITSAKRKAEHCWTAAGGEFAGDHRFDHIDGWFCDEDETFCVQPWRAGRRVLKYHGHKRNYDRPGVHTWSEIQPVVRDVCKPICEDKFRMQYNDYSPHNPSFITAFYPPKPVNLSVIGD